MCYICKCFGWVLDLIQRVLTFLLACIMCCAIYIGISVAIMAGIAYGYNYMLAEFLTLKRSDVYVYVRRGQFYDKPDLKSDFRRSGDAGDLFSSNVSDYQDTKADSDSKPLSDTWRKALDSRKYAEKLTKYTGQLKNENSSNIGSGNMAVKMDAKDMQIETPTESNLNVIHLTRVFSVTANPAMLTSIIPGRTNIVMRNFNPVEQITINPESNPVEAEFYQDADRPTYEAKSINKSKHKEKKENTKSSSKDISKSKYVPMRHWSDAESPHADYPAETSEVDESHIVYKPV